MHQHSSAPDRAEELAELSLDDRVLVTEETIRRWTAGLADDDWTLADVAALERRRLASLRTIRQGAEMSDMEWKLWRYLAKHAGRVRTFAQIAHHLWGTPDKPITPRMLRTYGGYESLYLQSIRRYVGSLRHKIEIDPLRPQHFATVRGVGYVWYDAPPAMDDGVNYARRSTQYARLRIDMLSLLNPAALPAGGERPDEYLDADVVDAVSITEDGEVIEARGITIGTNHPDRRGASS